MPPDSHPAAATPASKGGETPERKPYSHIPEYSFRILQIGSKLSRCPRIVGIGSSSGRPAMSGRVRFAPSSRTRLWNSSAVMRGHRTRWAAISANCAGSIPSESRPPTISPPCWHRNRIAWSTTRCGSTSTNWSGSWRPGWTWCRPRRSSPDTARGRAATVSPRPAGAAARPCSAPGSALGSSTCWPSSRPVSATESTK